MGELLLQWRVRVEVREMVDNAPSKVVRTYTGVGDTRVRADAKLRAKLMDRRSTLNAAHNEDMGELQKISGEIPEEGKR